MKIWQEFYCNNCDGWFRVRLNMALNMSVKMICPNCQHEHHRHIDNGQIKDNGHSTTIKEEICPPKSAYSKEPLTAKAKKHARDGIKIEQESDLNKRNPVADAMIKERWFEIYGGR